MLNQRPLVNLGDSNLICAFSSRKDGNMSLSYGDASNSLANRESFLGGLGIDHRDLVCAKQIHASSIAYVTEEKKGSGALSYNTSLPATDSMVTDKRRLPLAMFTADCLSIFLYDAKTPFIGLIHAGWKGTRENVTAKTMQFIKKQFQTDMANFYVSLGPAIRSCCYVVDKSFSDFFPFGLEKREEFYYLDLARINRQELLEAGVKEQNIFDSQICTSCQNQEFFSYRREGTSCGRMVSAVMLK